jgi:hypothetical protein
MLEPKNYGSQIITRESQPMPSDFAEELRTLDGRTCRRYQPRREICR